MDPRAWVVERLGAPADALRLVTVAPRAPGPGEVAVAVEAAGVNFPDLLLCAGTYQQRPPLPFSPGYEAAGTVVEAGRGATRRPGERVIVVPELPDGGFQERLVVPEAQTYPVPDGVDPVIAAVLHIASMTAHLAVHERAELREGETVLVSGGAGGVSSAAIQLARAAGARVIALATGAAKTQACVQLGAEIALDLLEVEDLPDAVRQFTAGRGADVVFDVVGGELFDRLRRCVAFGGRILVVGFTSGVIPPLAVNHVLLRNYGVLGVHLTPYRERAPELLRRVHAELLTRLADGTLAPRIDRVLPFEALPEALDAVGRRDVIGRIALRTGATG